MLDLKDLKDARQATLSRVLRFLGVDDSFALPEDLGVINATRSKTRTNRLGSVVLSESPAMSSARRLASSLLPSSAKRRVRSMLGSRYEAPVMAPPVRAVLQDALRDDIARFRKLTGMDFAHWDI